MSCLGTIPTGTAQSTLNSSDSDFMLIVISGPSCVGKSFCFEYLVARYGFQTLTPYTARPPRISESEGIHYHFRSGPELRELSGGFSKGYWARPLDQHWYGYSSHVDELPGDVANWIVQAYSDIALEIKKRHANVTTVFLDFATEAVFKRRNTSALHQIGRTLRSGRPMRSMSGKPSSSTIAF